MINKIDAILSLVPNAEVVVRGEEVEWHVPSAAPVTEEQIATELARLQAEFVSNEYQRQRAMEYPSIVDQLDTIYHNGIDAWKQSIKAVKDKYPKA
jgi:hypothetical protein